VGVLTNGQYAVNVYGREAKIPVGILENGVVDMSEVFPPSPPANN
jgi:hypothetical protein